jgi:hypothetical protein
MLIEKEQENIEQIHLILHQTMHRFFPHIARAKIQSFVARKKKFI